MSAGGHPEGVASEVSLETLAVGVTPVARDSVAAASRAHVAGREDMCDAALEVVDARRAGANRRAPRAGRP